MRRGETGERGDERFGKLVFGFSGRAPSTGLTLGVSGGGLLDDVVSSCALALIRLVVGPGRDGDDVLGGRVDADARVRPSSDEREPSLGWARAASRRRRTCARPRWSGA